MCHLWAGETFGQSFLRWILMNQNTVIWLCLSNFISRWHGPCSFSFSSWTLSYRTLWQRLSMFFMLLLSFKAWHANSCDTTYQEPDYFWQDRRNWKLKLFFFFCKVATRQTPDPTNTLLWEFPDKNMLRSTYWVGWYGWGQSRLKVIIREPRWNSRVEESFEIRG